MSPLERLAAAIGDRPRVVIHPGWVEASCGPCLARGDDEDLARASLERQRCEHVTPDLGVPVRVAPKAAPVAADPRQLSLLGSTP